MGVVEEMEGSIDANTDIIEETDCASDERCVGGDTSVGNVSNSSDSQKHIVWGSGVSNISNLNEIECQVPDSGGARSDKSREYIESTTPPATCFSSTTSSNIMGTPRKFLCKSAVQVPAAKLRKFRKYDTFIWVREPAKGQDALPAKPFSRLRSLNSL